MNIFYDQGPVPDMERGTPPENSEDSDFGRFLAQYGIVSMMVSISLIGGIVLLGIKLFG